MRSRWLLVGWLLVAGGQPARAQPSTGQPSTIPPSTGTISVDIANLRVDQGWEQCLLYTSAEGFPYDLSKAVQQTRVPIHDGRAVCAFPDVKPGVYAVAVWRDDKGDGKPEMGLFGPTYGIGTSNNAVGFMGPPKFDDARFAYKGGALLLAIRLTYHSAR